MKGAAEATPLTVSLYRTPQKENVARMDIFSKEKMAILLVI